jgi:hypothetical protein
MQHYLLDKMPPKEIERSLQVLQNLGLITSLHNVTELGRVVEPLPGQLRSRIMVALAHKIQNLHQLRPADFLLPAIEMAAVVDAQGVVTHEMEGEQFLCGGGRVPNHGRWIELINPPRGSDPIAQMRLLQRLIDLPTHQFAEWGVHVNQFQHALDIRKQLCVRFDIDPTVRAKRLSKEHTALLRECYWLGNIDQLHRLVSNSGGRCMYKPIINGGTGRQRILCNGSLLKSNAPQYLVGQRVMLDTDPFSDDPVRLITLADAVDENWLEGIAFGHRGNFDWLKTDPTVEMRKQIQEVLR